MLVVFPKPKWFWSTDFCTRVRPSTTHWALHASVGWRASVQGRCCILALWLRRSAFCKQGIADPTAQDTHLPPFSACPPFLLCTVSGILVSGTFGFSFPKERPLVCSKGLVGECIFWASRDGERTCGLIIPNMSLPLTPASHNMGCCQPSCDSPGYASPYCIGTPSKGNTMEFPPIVYISYPLFALCMPSAGIVLLMLNCPLLLLISSLWFEPLKNSPCAMK